MNISKDELLQLRNSLLDLVLEVDQQKRMRIVSRATILIDSVLDEPGSRDEHDVCPCCGSPGRHRDDCLEAPWNT